MAADQERADRIRQLKQEHPETTWQRIADHVGVTMRAAQSWQEKGGIEYANAKKLAALWDEDLDYIWRGRRTGDKTPDLLGAKVDGSQLDRVEAMLTEVLNILQTGGVREKVGDIDKRLRGVEDAVESISEVLLAEPAASRRERDSTRATAARRRTG